MIDMKIHLSPLSDPTLHPLLGFLGLLSLVTGSASVFPFHDLGTWDEPWSVVCGMSLSSALPLLPQGWVRLWVLTRNLTDLLYLSQHVLPGACDVSESPCGWRSL